MSITSNMPSIDLGTAVCASAQQVFCNVADEAVLLSMEDGVYYGLNDVAASIWELIQKPLTVLQIRDELLARYCEIGEEECERAVMGFLTEMISLKLVDLA
ncbi:MAG TPA: PqqD family protein [Gemmatimonadaceae bacterium]|jgi:hypothetical protein